MAKQVVVLSGGSSSVRDMKISGTSIVDYGVVASGVESEVVTCQIDSSNTAPVLLSGQGATVRASYLNEGTYAVEFNAVEAASIGNFLREQTIALYRVQTNCNATSRALDVAEEAVEATIATFSIAAGTAPRVGLDALTNVDISGTKTDGYVVYWDDTLKRYKLKSVSTGTLAALTDVDVTTKSDGDHLYWDNTASKWKAEAPPTGGSGSPSWVDLLADPSGTPHALDDEFDDATITGWTKINEHATYPVTEATDRVYLWAQNSGNGMTAIVKSFGTLTGVIQIDAAAQIHVGDLDAIDYLWAYLGLADGATDGSGNQFGLGVGLEYDSSDGWKYGVQYFEGTNWNGGGGVGGLTEFFTQSGHIYMRVLYNQSTNQYRCFISGNGIAWIYVPSGRAEPATPTHILLGSYFEDSNQNNQNSVLFEYVRITEDVTWGLGPFFSSDS